MSLSYRKNISKFLKVTITKETKIIIHHTVQQRKALGTDEIFPMN